MVVGDGDGLIECVGSSYDGPRRDEIMTLVTKTKAWFARDAHGRRSLMALAGGDRGVQELFTTTSEGDPRRLEQALLRAQREMSEAPLDLRVGVVEVPKQAITTQDLWRTNEFPRQRGCGRRRETSLLLVTSKVLGPTVLPGPTCVIKPTNRPDEAVLSVLKSIRVADPDARVVDVELDSLDSAIARMRNEDPQPFSLRLPTLIAGHRHNVAGPLALILSSRPDIEDVQVDGPARDIKGLRVGVRGNWSQPYETTVEHADGSGALVRSPASIKVSDLMNVHASPAFHARIARVQELRTASTGQVPPRPHLVAVTGEADINRIVDMATQAVSATDLHPHVAEFMSARHKARVFGGEQRTRQSLHMDRAIAATAFAAHLLDKTVTLSGTAAAE